MSGLYVYGMGGLGDCIYARPFVRALSERYDPLWLRTPWPQLYADLSVRPVKWDGLALRTQAKNQDAFDDFDDRPPRGVPHVFLRYGETWPAVTVMDELRASVADYLGDADPGPLDLPDFGPSPVAADKPLAVVRPVTLRSEWSNPARNPDPAYVTAAARHLRREGYHVVSVADVDGEAEWFVGEPPEADTALHAGELSVTELMALIAHADVVVGGVGFIVPAAMAAGTPLVAINGGHGLLNAMEAVTDPAYMDLATVRFIEPDDFCRCDAAGHTDCDKTITDFALKFRAALQDVTRARAAA